MEFIHKTTTVGNKPHVKTYDVKREMGTMDIFKSEHVKNTKITE